MIWPIRLLPIAWWYKTYTYYSSNLFTAQGNRRSIDDSVWFFNGRNSMELIEFKLDWIGFDGIIKRSLWQNTSEQFFLLGPYQDRHPSFIDYRRVYRVNYLIIRGYFLRIIPINTFIVLPFDGTSFCYLRVLIRFIFHSLKINTATNLLSMMIII